MSHDRGLNWVLAFDGRAPAAIPSEVRFRLLQNNDYCVGKIQLPDPWD